MTNLHLIAALLLVELISVQAKAVKTIVQQIVWFADTTAGVPDVNDLDPNTGFVFLGRVGSNIGTYDINTGVLAPLQNSPSVSFLTMYSMAYIAGTNHLGITANSGKLYSYLLSWNGNTPAVEPGLFPPFSFPGSLPVMKNVPSTTKLFVMHSSGALLFDCAGHTVINLITGTGVTAHSNLDMADSNFGAMTGTYDPVFLIDLTTGAMVKQLATPSYAAHSLSTFSAARTWKVHGGLAALSTLSSEEGTAY